jgi:hypothetical protein
MDDFLIKRMDDGRQSLFTEKQKKLTKKHGTPAEFAQATYAAVPGFISMDEAREGIEKYNREWAEAGRRQ